jgi:hypothetical protein
MDAIEFIQSLVDQSLCYGIKSPDTDLYDFGFGNMVNAANTSSGGKEVCPFILHATCRFKVIWKNGECRVDKYHEDTPCEIFHSEVKRFVGLKVKRVELSDKNDLWLDLGDYWIVFATFENGEESWRFFTPGIDSPHLVASDSWLYFSN